MTIIVLSALVCLSAFDLLAQVSRGAGAGATPAHNGTGAAGGNTNQGTPLGRTTVGIGQQGTTAIGQPTTAVGQPTIGIGGPTTGTGQPTTVIGQPTSGIGQPTMGIGQQGTTAISQQGTIGIGQPTIGIGQQVTGTVIDPYTGLTIVLPSGTATVVTNFGATIALTPQQGTGTLLEPLLDGRIFGPGTTTGLDSAQGGATDLGLGSTNSGFGNNSVSNRFNLKR